MVFGDKNSDMFLLHKIKSFGLKKVLDLFFKNKKKMVFGFIKDLICFEKKKKVSLITEKLDLVCIC